MWESAGRNLAPGDLVGLGRSVRMAMDDFWRMMCKIHDSGFLHFCLPHNANYSGDWRCGNP